jgi:hypothetical protein
MNTRDVVNAIEDLIDAKLNFGYETATTAVIDAAGNRLVKALRADESDLAPCAAKLKVDFEEDLPKSRYVTFLYDKGDSGDLHKKEVGPTRRMIQVTKDEYGFISGIDVDKDEYRTFSKLKIIGNIEEIV